MHPRKRLLPKKKVARALASSDMDFDFNPPMLRGNGSASARMIGGTDSSNNVVAQGGALGIAATAAVGLYLYKKRGSSAAKKKKERSVSNTLQIV